MVQKLRDSSSSLARLPTDEALALIAGSYSPVQRKLFVDDQSRRRVAFCGRRAGKSAGIARWLVEGCLKYPGEQCLYVAVSRANARQNLGSALERLEKQLNLGLSAKEADGQLYWTVPGGGRIWLAGCSDRAELEKFRGDRLARAVIDEADSLRKWLEPLALEVIEPRLLDLGGDLIMSGTPGAIPAGFFHQVTTDPLSTWSVHHWTALDNPFLQDVDAYFARKKAELPEATFRREYMGEWVRDDEALVLRFDYGRNACAERDMPAGDWRTVIGIDLGVVDACAWVVMRYRPGSPETYLVRAVKRAGLAPSAAAAHTEQLRREFPGARLIADTGGIGRAFTQEWASRYGINCEAATKTNKAQHLRMFAGEVASGQVKIDPFQCSTLLDEWETLQWGDDRQDLAEGSEDHATMAAVYGWRAITPTYAPELELTDAEQAAKEQARLKRDAMFRRRQPGDRPMGNF